MPELWSGEEAQVGASCGRDWQCSQVPCAILQRACIYQLQVLRPLPGRCGPSAVRSVPQLHWCQKDAPVRGARLSATRSGLNPWTTAPLCCLSCLLIQHPHNRSCRDGATGVLQLYCLLYFLLHCLLYRLQYRLPTGATAPYVPLAALDAVVHVQVCRRALFLRLLPCLCQQAHGLRGLRGSGDRRVTGALGAKKRCQEGCHRCHGLPRPHGLQGQHVALKPSARALPAEMRVQAGQQQPGPPPGLTTASVAPSLCCPSNTRPL